MCRLGIPFAAALAGALEGGAAGRLGLVETLEPVPGVPHAQHPLRLAKQEIEAAFADPGALGAQRELTIESVARAPAAAFGADKVAHAARALAAKQLLVIRGASRRAVRQLAADVAAHRGETAHIVRVGDELPRLAELSRLRDGLIVLDLHARSTPAVAPNVRPLVLLVDEAADTSNHATVDAPAIGYPEARRVWTRSSDPDRPRSSPPVSASEQRKRAAPPRTPPTRKRSPPASAGQGARRMGGGALPVMDHAVERERQGAGDAQTAPGEDQGDQPAGGIGPTVQVGR